MCGEPAHFPSSATGTAGEYSARQVHLGQLACVRLVTIAWHVIDLNVRYANAGTIATPLKLHP